MGRHRKIKEPQNGAARQAVAIVGVTGAISTAATLITAQEAAAAPVVTVWDKLAQCESSGNFKNNDTGRNGHYGGFQFSPATWRSVGGTGNPANASIAEQLKRAKILLARSGPGQWECKVGLTKANGAAQGLTVLNRAQTPPSRSTARTPAPKAAPTSAAARAVAFARAQLGKPYVFGGSGPNSWDCSGLVQAAWRAGGISLPRVSQAQFKSAPVVPASSARPGDLVVYRGGAHIAIYIGNGQIIEAPSPGKRVQIAPFRSGWYATNFTAVVRPGGTQTVALRDPVETKIQPRIESKIKAKTPSKTKTPAPRTVAKEGTGTYKVKSGDWLEKIARAHNVRGGWQHLYEINEGVVGSDPDLIHPGQVLKLGS